PRVRLENVGFAITAPLDRTAETLSPPRFSPMRDAPAPSLSSSVCIGCGKGIVEMGTGESRGVPRGTGIMQPIRRTHPQPKTGTHCSSSHGPQTLTDVVKNNDKSAATMIRE